MNAAVIGQLVGFTLACAGVAYIWLGLLAVLRVLKRWPRASTWSAAGVAALLGLITAAGTPDSVLVYLIGTALAVAFVLYRGLRGLPTHIAESAKS